MLITNIALNPNSTFLCQFYPGDFLKFADSTIIVFFIAALIIRCLQQIVAFLRCTWLLLLFRYSLFTSVPDGIFFPLPPIFSVIICCNKFMSVLFIETFVLSWEIFLGVSSKFIRD